MFDVEGAVREAFAVADPQVPQHAEDDPVGDHRRGEDFFGVASGLERPAFEERIAVGVEEVAPAAGEREGVGLRAVVDDAEEAHELGPGAVALIHGVRVVAVVVAELVEEARDGVVPGVDFAFDHQAAIFGVQQKDEPEEDGEHADQLLRSRIMNSESRKPFDFAERSA